MRTLLAPPPLCSGPLDLTGDEAHHALKVLRMQPGQVLRLADGCGGVAEATITATGRHHISCEVGPVVMHAPGRGHDLLMAVAPPKGNRWDDMTRGLTELGVGALAPLACDRGERVPKLHRAERVAREATKQCQRPWLPQLLPLQDIPTLVSGDRIPIICDPRGEPMPVSAAAPTVLLVGPEGGWSAAELDHFATAGVRRMRLVQPILRIETAALAAAAILLQQWECYAS